jgi:DNA-binding transcriptional LysR family regulator
MARRTPTAAAAVTADLPGPTLRQIDAFRATMQLGSLSAAARAQGISQPAMTQLMQQMEAMCGLQLFARRGGKLLPTPEAHAVLAEVERVQLGLDAVRQRIAMLRTHSVEQIRVGCLHALAIGPMPRAVVAFQQRHPHTHVQLLVESSRAIRDALLAGSIDVGLIADAVPSRGLEVSPLYELPCVCLMSASHPYAKRPLITPNDLAGAPLIALSATDRAQLRINQVFDDAGVQPHTVIETPYGHTQCALVAAGAGLALVNPAVAFEFEGIGLRALPFQPTVLFKASLMFHPQRAPSQATLELIDELRRELEQIHKRAVRDEKR